MKKRLTSTEIVRRFGSVLAEVQHGCKTIVVVKSGKPVAEIGPTTDPATCTLDEFARIWLDHPTDPDGAFADDLDLINKCDREASSPWD